MRDILFRAKCLDNYEWIEGWYYQKPNPCSVDGSPVRHFISNCPPFASEIDHDTVCQYVGIKDKNGKKIFEGDIVVMKRRDMTVRGIVEFGNCSFVVNDRTKELFFYMFPNFEYEVLGNGYDNPELLSEIIAEEVHGRLRLLKHDLEKN